MRNLAFALSLVACLASCQVSQQLKQMPVVGQIATTTNSAVGRGDLNETGSIFAPKHYKRQNYKYIGSVNSTDSAGNTVEKPIDMNSSFEDAYKYLSDRTPDEQKTFIYSCAARIDENYLEWLEAYVAGRASFNAGFEILGQGLSAAATICTPPGTKTVLSGLSTFSQGVNSSIENNFFMSLTVLQQVPVMNGERTKARKELDEYMSSSKPFVLSHATSLLDNYFFAGTQFTAFGAKPDKAG